MLTGAMRAARTVGVLRLERVWVVAVPVVMLLVLERIVTLYFVQWSMCNLFLTHPYAELVGRAGPWSLRTALVATVFAATGYALLWAVRAIVEYAREVKRHGRRLFLRGGATGRLVIFGAIFVLLAYETMLVTSLPTAEDVMAGARVGFRSGWAWQFSGAVIHDVPGIRSFCRENINDPARPQRLLAAIALTRLGEGSNLTVDTLRSITRDEYLDPQNALLFNELVKISSVNMRFLPFRRTGVPPEKQEELWQKFRRECIP